MNGVSQIPVSQPGQIPLSPTGQPLINQQGQPVQQFVQQQPQVVYPMQQGGQAFIQPTVTQQQRLAVNGNEILDGPGVPAELRGRTVAEAMRIYGALADDFVTRQRTQQAHNQNQQQPNQQQPTQQFRQQPQVQQPQQQFRQQPQQPQHQQPSGDFFQNPDERLRAIVSEVVNQAVAPFVQQNTSVGIRSAMEQARASIPDFAALEPDIMEAVRGSSEESLTRIDYWQHAADLARGRRARMQMQPQPRQTFGPGQMVPAQGGFQQPMMPVMQNPNQHIGVTQNIPQAQRPQTVQFFTEAPTAPSVLQHTHSGALTQRELAIAAAGGMTPEAYLAWRDAQQVIR